MIPGALPFPAINPERPTLRIGIFFSNTTNYDFLKPVLEAIQQSTFANLALVIHSASHAPDFNSSPDIRGMLPRVHRFWDAKRNREKQRSWRDFVDATLKQVPTVTLSGGDKPSMSEQEQVRAHNLDIIISCDVSGASDLGPCTQRGVWTIGIAGQDGRQRSTYFPEGQLYDEPLSRVELVAHAGTGNCALTLGHSIAKNPQSLSLIEAAEVEGQVAAELICWKLWQLQAVGWQILAHCPSGSARASTCGRHRESSSWAAGPSFLGNHLWNKISAAMRPTGTREWQIGLRRAKNLLPWEGTAEDYQGIAAPCGHYLADPFLFEHQGRTWLFAEDYVNAESKGRLVCAALGPDGQVGTWQTVLDLPCHLSFPYVFAHGSDIYLIPESSAGGTVDLYQAVEFPCRWTKIRTLWAGPALDTVPYQAEDGCWYFFTSVQPHKYLPPQLLLFTAPDLLATWRLHPASPLSLDVRYARNAGRILEVVDESGQGRLIRLSQDGSGKYGCKMHFHEIEVLTPDRYAERLVATRLPPSGRDGVHQYDRVGNWEVIDVSSPASPRQTSGA